MKKYVFCFSILIGIIACKNKDIPGSHNIMGKKGGVKKEISSSKQIIKQSKFSAEVVKLNDQAVLLINEGNEISYQEAIRLLDKAIRLDTAYYIAYSNKAVVLTRLGEYDEAINIYRHLVTNIKPDYPEAYTMLGMLNDKVGEKYEAIKYYKKAIEIYSERITGKEELMDMINRAHLKFILDSEKGLEEIDSLIRIYPENDLLQIFRKYMFIDYNHSMALDKL